jgi:photosystem II stability/assembly factor-like uncharacterized protein
MITPGVGWALGLPERVPEGTPIWQAGGRPWVVRTSDGGAHWASFLHEVAYPVVPVAADFHDEGHAWVLLLLDGESTASNETVVVASTDDGGLHWNRSARLYVNGQAARIQFADTSHGWVFATPSAGGALGSQDTTLYRTIDGGVHWQLIKAASQVGGAPGVYGTLPEACPGGGPIGPPSFIDAQTGWIGAFCDRQFLSVTHDGGLSWVAQPLPSFPGLAYAEPARVLYDIDPAVFTSSRDGALVVRRGFTTGANALQEAAVYTTHDGGASWAGFRLPRPELAIDFVDSQYGWMILAGAGGAIEVRSLYATADGGRSWQQVAGPQDYFNRELSFVSPTIGFIEEPAVKDQPARLLKTTDRGTSWVPIPFIVE